MAEEPRAEQDAPCEVAGSAVEGKCDGSGIVEFTGTAHGMSSNESTDAVQKPEVANAEEMSLTQRSYEGVKTDTDAAFTANQCDTATAQKKKRLWSLGKLELSCTRLKKTTSCR